MKAHIKQIRYLVLTLVLLLLITTGCYERSENTKTPFPTNTFTPVPTSTAIFTLIPSSTSTPVLIAATPSPWPTVPFLITPNADQLARWREYEKALATKLIPSPIPEDVLCEWVILGQSEQEVYVWAFCQVLGDIPTGASVPAVIYLGADGVVQSVEFPGSGSLYPDDVRKLFPPDVQEMIFAHLVDVGKMEAHIYVRLEHPEPPLIVLSATPLP